MSLSHSPSIVTNGLSFYYDMSNSKKSWKGAPATNLVTNASSMSGWNNYSNGPANPFITELGTTGWYMNNAGSWNGCYKSISGITPGTYTFSCWAKYLGGHPNQTGGAVYISGWGGSDTAAYINKNIVGWQRISKTINVTTTALTFYLISWGGTNNSDNSSWQVTMPQMELNTFATPFVNGTRSNTQSIVDLTGKNTITANSLTYAADGTFSFNGSANYLTVSNFVNKPTSAITCEAWIKPTKPVMTGTIRGGAISATNSMYLGIIDSIDGGSTHALHWANQTSVNRVHSWNGNVPNNAWSHIVGTYDGATMRAYLNGVQIYSAAQTGTIPDATYVLGTYGNALQDGVHNFNGVLPSSRIYNRALTAAEVQQNFQALRGRYGI